jgi:HPt (histidine-containing phosphotransfer) domain-containing protein
MESKIFEFDQRLDAAFLRSLYEDDIENAVMSFDFFLNKYPQHLKEIEDDFIAGDIKGFRQKVHKVKPTFSYVGLTAMSVKAAAIERLCDETNDLNNVKDLYQELKNSLQEIIPVIEGELERMKT